MAEVQQQKRKVESELKFPDPKSFGKAEPGPEDLASHYDLPFLGGMKNLTPADAEKLVFPRATAAQSGANGFLLGTVFDADRSGSVSAREMAEFGYRADQAGNRDGRTSVEEYNGLVAQAYGRYLLARGKELGLAADTFNSLESRLVSGSFSLSGTQGLLDALDVSQTNRDRVVKMRKLAAAPELFDAVVGSAPAAQQDQFGRVVLEHLARTGQMLVGSRIEADGTLILAADSLQKTPRDDGRVDYRFQSTEYRFEPGATPRLVRLETKTATTAITVVPEERYSFGPEEANPYLDSLTDKLLKNFAADETVQRHVKTLEQGMEAAVSDPAALERLLAPIHSALQKTLGLDPAVPLSVERANADSPGVFGAYNHPLPGAPAKPEIVLYLLPRLRNAQTAMEASVLAGSTQSAARTEAMRGLFLDLVGSLIEENVHADQHQTTDRYNANPDAVPQAERGRIADYALNRTAMIDPIDLSAFFGDESLYLRQPFEADGKRIREAVAGRVTKR